MNNTAIVIIVIIALIVLFIGWLIIKPYTIKYDTTLSFTGGIGAGKTLNAVKTARVLWKKRQLRVKILNWIYTKKNKHIRKENIKRYKAKKPLKKEIELIPKPWIYSNIPICMDKKHNLWSRKLKKEHLLLTERIEIGSIVVIDELPQMVNQFNWNIKEIQNNVNEFITFFRHYIQGNLIITAQSMDDVVAQIRRKLNTYYWLFDFHKFLCFYRVRICSLQTSEMISSITTTFIEENTKWKYGIIWHKYYDSHCYSERYDRCTKNEKKRFMRYKTNKITRFTDYDSPLDRPDDK